MTNYTLFEKLKKNFGKGKLAKILTVALVAPLLTVIVAPAQLAPQANAAAVYDEKIATSGNFSIKSVSWNIVGLDSNNVNAGPNIFPFGAKVCNKTASPETPTITWNWGSGDATAIHLTSGSSTTRAAETIAANSCIYAFWSVEVTRASASYNKTRTYSISVSTTNATDAVSTDANVAIKVEKLVSQARNDVQTLKISNGLTNVGDTATVTMTGATSTSYEQLTAWPVFDLAYAQIVSMNFTFSIDNSTYISSPLSQLYANGCDWNPIATPTPNVCLGSGKAGGTVGITLVIKRVALGDLNMNGIIYDFSGSSFHYNSDYGTDGLLSASQVNTPPVAANDAIDDSFFTPLNTSLTGATVATNDSENVTPVAYTKLTDPSHGTISSFNSSGVFTYVPTTGFSGFDSFTYKLCKSDNTSCDTATVTIVVGIQAVNDSVSVPYQGTLTNEPLWGNDYYNSYTLGTNIFYDTATAVTSGTITSFSSSAGTFNYTAANGFSGAATFTYTICRTSCISPTETSTATVTINVGPLAVDDSYSISSGSSTSGDLSANDIYPASKTFALNSTTNANGTVTLNSSTGTFTYTATSGFSGTATFTYDVCDSFGTCSTATVTITVPASPPPVVLITPEILWPTPAPIYFPTPLSSVQLNAVAKYNGQTVAGTYVYETKNGVVLDPGTYALRVIFYPAESDKYSTTTASVIQLVLNGKPTITWPNPAPKTGPYTLDPTVLNATCSVAGTLTYEPALGAVLQPGTYTLKVTCTPTDPKYGPVTTTVTLVVNPTLTWVDPSEKTGPYTLDASVLNAKCNTPGVLTYDPALGAVLQPGTYTLKVTCTPTDPTLKPLTTTVTLKVNPTLTWVDPPAKLGPYTLEPTVLNSVCNTPGTLTYDPALGAVLQPGIYTLKVTCTPTDPTLKPLTTTVPFKVVKPTVIDIQPITIPGNVSTDLNIPAVIEKLSPKIDSVCTGLTGAVLSGGIISYTPNTGFSGNTCVNVKVLIDGVLQNVRIPVVVNPVAPTAFKEPVTFYKGLITWSASPNATGYLVKIRGKLICTTVVAQLSCNAPQTVGPATPVLVTALGNDNTSTTVEAKYIPRRVLAFTVYFDVAKFALTKASQETLNKAARIMKEEGFVNLELLGHTDNSPFDNVTLSKNRSKATFNFIKKLLPVLNPIISSYSDSLPAVANSSAANKALNRRTEGYVS